MNKRRKIELQIGGIVILAVAFSLALYFIGAERIVEIIGVENTYLVIFFIALFGGMTSIGGVSYTGSIITFVAGGASPWIIALAAGLGTTLGDVTYYMVARHGSKALGDGWLSTKVKKVSEWLKNRSAKMKFLVVYLYMGFTPFPNDPLTITLGLSRVPKKIVIPALALGDTTFAFLLAYLGNWLPFV